MKEEFLYFIWKYKLFSINDLFSVDNCKIIIENIGVRNENSGPDFLNAQIIIDTQKWFGNIEMHIKSSDWYLHNHETDKNFDSVILHVVWEYDMPIYLSGNKLLPTLELKKYIDKSSLNNFKKLFLRKEKWILCENHINTVDKFLFNNWLERLYFERLENKSKQIYDILKSTNYDFEATLFQLICKSFGLRRNGDSFLDLAKSIPFSILRKVSSNKLQLTALLYGQAGFLSDNSENIYQKNLFLEYKFLKHKFDLKPLDKNIFQFFRVRPNNFPTIRIAQLISLYNKYNSLFFKIIEIKSKEEYYRLFTLEIDDYWKVHYNFNSPCKKSSRKISKAFIDLLLINTIIPLKFVYANYNKTDTREDLLKLVSKISPEKNSIIERFSGLGITVKNALETQSLLQLNNNYCIKKNCLKCAIGYNLIKN